MLVMAPQCRRDARRRGRDRSRARRAPTPARRAGAGFCGSRHCAVILRKRSPKSNRRRLAATRRDRAADVLPAPLCPRARACCGAVAALALALVARQYRARLRAIRRAAAVRPRRRPSRRARKRGSGAAMARHAPLARALGRLRPVHDRRRRARRRSRRPARPPPAPVGDGRLFRACAAPAAALPRAGPHPGGC